MNIYHLDYIHQSCQHFGVKHLYHKEENKTNLVWKPGYSLYPLVYAVISLSSSVSSSHSSSSYPSRPSYSHFSYIMGRWVTGQNQYLTQALLKLKLQFYMRMTTILKRLSSLNVKTHCFVLTNISQGEGLHWAVEYRYVILQPKYVISESNDPKYSI